MQLFSHFSVTFRHALKLLYLFVDYPSKLKLKKRLQMLIILVPNWSSFGHTIVTAWTWTYNRFLWTYNTKYAQFLGHTIISMGIQYFMQGHTLASVDIQ